MNKILLLAAKVLINNEINLNMYFIQNSVQEIMLKYLLII